MPCSSTAFHVSQTVVRPRLSMTNQDGSLWLGDPNLYAPLSGGGYPGQGGWDAYFDPAQVIIHDGARLIATKGEYASWRATRATGDFDLRTFSIRAYPVEKVPEMRPGMSAYVDWQQRQ